MGALARYTWGAASEISDAGKKNNIWRALDSDFTAPLWGRWQIAAERVRLSRSTSGLIEHLEAAAERAPADIGGDAAQAAAALPPRQEVVAEVHPAVVQWAKDNHKEAAFLEAATRGPESLTAYLSKNLPPALVELVRVRPELPDPSEDDGAVLSKIRHDLASKGLGMGGGYWIGPDGYPVCGPFRPPASQDAKVRARRAQLMSPHPWQRDDLRRGLNALASASATTPGHARKLRAHARDAFADTLTGSHRATMSAYILADAVARAEMELI